jgi:hypothetical protein
MGDLYWERIAAGHYETQWFVNKYKYKILGEGIEWEAYYIYQTKDPAKRVWRRVRYGNSDRLKGAKILCQEHNNNPRRIFKIGVRSKQKAYRNREYVYIARLSFIEHTKDRKTGELKPTGWGIKYHVELPAFYESYSGEISYLGEEYLVLRQRLNDVEKIRFSDLEEDEKQEYIDAS